MPLVLDAIAPDYDESRNMIGVWMRVPGAIGSVRGVRVFVTLDALWTQEPGSVGDLASALEIFERHSGKIELAASRKFDYQGPEAGEQHEGRPVIVVTTYELWGLPRD
jgi:hypothetical protein